MSDASLRETVARVLVRLLEAYSPSGSEEEAIGVFTEVAEELGFPRVWVDGAGNAHASTSGGPPRVALIGHIDTVPGELPVSRGNGVIRGRGAVDAKGPLTVFLVAASSIGDACPVQVSALVGEEADSPGARFLVNTGFYAPYILVGEPTGTDGIAIGYRGSIKIRVECRGGGGHSSSPEIGDSALDRFLVFVAKLRGLPGVSASIVELHTHARADNVLPELARGLVDLRVSRELDPDMVMTMGDLLGCTVRTEGYTAPVRVRPQEPVPRSLARALLELGLRPRYLVKRGTSDMNILYPACSDSIAAYGPGDASLSHTDREFVEERDLELAVKVVAASLGYLCGSRGFSSNRGKHPLGVPY